MNAPLRLQKYLALCGIASRRKSEEIIRQGRVRVDDAIVTVPGTKILPGIQEVHVDGRIALPEESGVYLLLNKPRGYITTLSDPQGRPVVTSLLKKDVTQRVFPVGRLDLDVEGALILTNDGDLAQTIQHPRHEVTKTYEALVRGIPAETGIKQLASGVLLDGRKTSPARLSVLKKTPRSALVQIIIREGRKRQVKKMFQAVGHPVLHLRRIAYGKLFLHKLPSGQYRSLSPSDLKKIFL